MEKIGFLGAGNMAQALIKGIIAAGIYKAEDIFISDVSCDRLEYMAKEYGVIAAEDNSQLVGKIDILVLSVKPQTMADALASIKNSFKADTLVISIAAGIKIKNITDILSDAAVVRVMPNMSALIGRGASALFANEKAKPMLDKAKEIFSAVGHAVIIDDEDLMDAVTAVSGSGPAYFFLLIEEMITAGIELGLPENITKDLVLQTAAGAALLAQQAEKDGQSPCELRKKVTSPGGITEAALKVFAEGKFSELVSAAIKRGCQRGKELAS